MQNFNIHSLSLYLIFSYMVEINKSMKSNKLQIVHIIAIIK